MIIDCHTHVWNPTIHFSSDFIEETSRTHDDSPDMNAAPDRHLKAAKSATRTIVFGLQASLCGIKVPNDYVAAHVRRHPQELIGFASIDPSAPMAEDELRRAVEAWEMRGLALAPAYQGLSPTDEYLWPIYEYCASRHLPIVFKLGARFARRALLAHAHPGDLDAVALRYPGLPLIVAHLGDPWIDECIALVRKHPNVYADLSDLPGRPWLLYNALLRVQEERVVDKILLGSSFPFATLDDTLGRISGVNILVKGSSLPRVAKTAIDEIVNRDSLSVLGLT